MRIPALIAVSFLSAGPALAQISSQPYGAQAPQGQQPVGVAPANGADQLVGLFGATCLHFAGDTAGLRSFLTQQHAQPMPPQVRDTFLAGRQGQVFDVSVPNVNLALITLDNGGCEAVAEKANPGEVVSDLQQAASEAHVPLQVVGTQGEKGPNGVQHSAFQLTFNGQPMHVLVSTASATPQAVLTLVPR